MPKRQRRTPERPVSTETAEGDQHDDSDLSAYERKRLANIERNQAMLASLGILTMAAAPPEMHEPIASKPKRVKRTPRAPTRRSARLQAQPPSAAAAEAEAGAEAEAAGAESEPPRVDYDAWPEEPAELDDSEFEVFAALRRWRLKRKRELDIEAYKICQNRTLCELVRRRRNDASWATGAESGDQDASSSKTEDLVECWGIGPSKAAPSGFGHEMLEVLGRPALQEKLKQSRAMPAATAT